MTPADALLERARDPFCERGVLAAINALADASHSKPMADLVTAGKWRPELLLTLGKVAPPRYANFIGRYKDDRDAEVRQAVAGALGLIDNEAVAVPVLIQLLTRRARPAEFHVRWEASESLVKLLKRRRNDTLLRRVAELLADADHLTAALAARALALAGEPRGPARLRELTADVDVRVREEAALALGEAKDRAAQPRLTQLLTDENLSVRATAVYALGRLGDPRVIPSLRQAAEASLAYEQELERRKEAGESESALRERYGLGAYDLRQTFEEAIAAAQNP